MRVLLLGTSGCHLCELAEQLLVQYINQSQQALEIEYIDIAEQQQWQEQYETRIPVLIHPETKQDLGWPFNMEDIDAFLASSSRKM